MKQNRTTTIKFLTPDELRRLFIQIKNPRDKAIFVIAYRHGLRASEVGMLQVSDIDFKSMRLMCHRLKNSLSGEHTMQADELRIVKTHLKNRSLDSPILFTSNRGLPISRRMLDVLMKRYCADADIPKDKAHFHALKHSIATHLLGCDGDIRFVQDWVGHSNIQNTVIYTHLVSTSRDLKARKHFAKLPSL